MLTTFLRSLSHLARRTLQYLPTTVRKRLIRRMVRVSGDLPPGMELKIAETREELAGAFRLVHDSYVAEGFMEADPSGLRVTKYHMLPTTTTLIAKLDGEVVATLSLIQDGAFGVPMDMAFDLAHLRREGRRFAEISSLAVAPRLRRQGAMLWHLTKLMSDYSFSYLKLDCWVASANPKHNYLYEGIWNFKRLPCESVANYAYANGAPAVPWFAVLDTWKTELFAAYGEREATQNLPQFYFHGDASNAQMPSRRYHRAFDAVMTAELFRHFFVDATSGLALLSPRERADLAHIYKNRQISDDLGIHGILAQRQAVRFNVACSGRVHRPRNAGTAIEVRDVSTLGIGGRVREALPTGEEVMLEIAVGDFKVARVVTKVARYDSSGLVGFEVLRGDECWERFILALERSWDAQKSLHTATPTELAA